jgi:hypothetical protein
LYECGDFGKSEIAALLISKARVGQGRPADAISVGEFRLF